jgi:mono/diheme cytochrome c family protein
VVAPSHADQALVDKGAYLARAGGCEACHTTPGGRPYAGGAAINSPFGRLYAPNITPDKTYGIGAWNDDEFYRAMHNGVGKHGQYLYPAFPYQWFTKVSRQDVLAIKAYLDTIPPVNVASKPTRLSFPFDLRSGLGIWNEAYFKPEEFKPDPAKAPEWNRGAYLVEGLGHCGDCHTPKNVAMAPDNAKAFSGGQIDDWYAPNITSDPSRGIGKWSDDELFAYLKAGATPSQGVVAGPMAQVVHDSLAHLTDADIHAIVTYLKTTPAIADYEPVRLSQPDGAHAVGAAVYLDHCASCHQLNGAGRPGAVPALADNGLVTAKGPENVIRVILQGRLATGTFAPMPAVGRDMTDQEVAEVADYVRNAWSNAAPWITKSDIVAEIRAKTISTLSGAGANGETGNPCGPGPYASIAPIPDPKGEIETTLASMTDLSMLTTVPTLINQARQTSPGISQADIVNGLMLAYCRVEMRTGALGKPKGRRDLDQFGLLVYSELTSNGQE